ncbi:VF530 family DNA-binding protein [Shewanella sp. YIC-542]|uniref:VF530 family protein n=1 Tax=Shewanella mytili TaxID=3377111 RepID=UPI00398F8D1D
MTTPPDNQAASKDPLHGLTLENILKALIAHYGFDGLAQHIRVRCFSHEPSLKSSLKFLRKTPWARAKAERLYLTMKGIAIPDYLRQAPEPAKAPQKSANATTSSQRVNAGIWKQ